MKELILNVDIWRCGAQGQEGVCALKTKNGDTHMLDRKGGMCCLGQFSRQFGMADELLLEESTPMATGRKMPLLTKHDYSSFLNYGAITDTTFSNKAMDINDDCNTTIQVKIERLTALCKKHKYNLKVIGQIPKAA